MDLMPTALVWLRRDLRLHDHAALAAATAQARGVAGLFVFDTAILSQLADRDDRRVTFIFDSLREVDAQLRAQGSHLLVAHGDPVTVVPAVAAALGVAAVFANGDTEPYARQRDGAVRQALAAQSREFVTLPDQVVLTGRSIANLSGEPYRVFTPYRNAWRRHVTPDDFAERVVDTTRFLPSSRLKCDHAGPLGNLAEMGFIESPPAVAAGTTAGQARLRQFASRVDDYAVARDFPARAGTSGLSPHLRHGTVSVREAFRAAQTIGGPGAEKWIDELIWREFYQMILAEFPHVVGHAFRPEYEGIAWSGGTEELEAWQAGQTGYPIVDAAMRCLRATGDMHNRLRMIVASFLTKDLLVDWRAGEAHFARYLLDFDLASNNGGWQWAASTGCDAQPYFRIFNPVRQSERFDPDGEFIQQWVPELAALPAPHLHWPHGAECLYISSGQYPAPIVTHEVQRAAALRLFAEARERYRPDAQMPRA